MTSFTKEVRYVFQIETMVEEVKLQTRKIAEEERVAEELEQIIMRAYKSVFKLSKDENLSYRLAAYIIGINKVVEASELRGFLNG